MDWIVAVLGLNPFLYTILVVRVFVYDAQSQDNRQVSLQLIEFGFELNYQLSVNR